MPNLYVPSYPYRKVTSRGGECERRHWRLKGEMMKCDSSRYVRQDCVAIFVDREEQITPRCETESSNVLSMRKRKGMGFVTVGILACGLFGPTQYALDQVKNCHSIPDWRKETRSIRTEKQVSLTIDSP